MKIIRNILNIVLYVIMFFFIQLVTTFVVVGIQCFFQGIGTQQIMKMAGEGQLMPDSNGMIIISVVSSILTIALFIALHWARPSRSYMRSRPWTTLAWVIVLALGTLIPSTFLQELMPFDMPEDMQEMLRQMMHNRWGYFAIGMLVPLAEELVFRGAILRALLEASPSISKGRGWEWMAILISALIFGAVHGNMPQGIHATLIGLLLGWMYWRTRSIVPGVVFHWVNNTAAYVIANLIPNAEDAKLIDIFHGSQTHVYLAVLFSLLIMAPALFQLWIRLKEPKEEQQVL